MKPAYGMPTRALMDASLDAASRFASFRNPRLIAVAVGRVVPREMIVLEDDMVDLMRKAPESVPPIVVAPWGDVHVVVDGHHRLAGSFEAGMKSVWAMEVDLVKLKHLAWPEWY